MLIRLRFLAWRNLAVAAALVALSGCPDASRDSQRATAPPAPEPDSLTLSIAVGDDPLLRGAIDLLNGEWREATGGRFQTVAVPDWTAPGVLDQADLVVFPPVLMGQLSEGGSLRPVRSSVLQDPEVAAGDYYPAVRDRVLSYGGVVMALPLGCPPPLVAIPAELAQAGRPIGWQDLRVDAASQASGLTLAERFLAQAAAYGYSPARESLLFQPESMAPRLSAPPFRRALQRMRDAGEGPAWVLLPERDAKRSGVAAVAPLPAAAEVYDPLSDAWSPAPAGGQHVTLVGARGQLIGVTSTTRNAAAAFRLLSWLASKNNSRSLATASPRVGNVRQSLGRLPDDWVGSGDRGLAREVATAADASWRNEKQYGIPRILQVDRYMQVLNEAIAAALQSGDPAVGALDEAAQRWDAITDEVGRDRQREAYLRHLGVLQFRAESR